VQWQWSPEKRLYSSGRGRGGGGQKMMKNNGFLNNFPLRINTMRFLKNNFDIPKGFDSTNLFIQVKQLSLNET
jgi:hypothetical protein